MPSVSSFRLVDILARAKRCVLVNEIVDGIGGVSVPIRNRTGVVVAAMSISMVLGSRTREQIVTDYLPPLQRAAQTTQSTSSPLLRNAGAFGYTASTSMGPFFGANNNSNPWLSTDFARVSVIFNGFTDGVQAIGGNFFSSNQSGNFQDGSVTLTATDIDGSLTQTIVNTSTTSFLGFISTDTLTSLQLAVVQPVSGFLWPTADNLILARRLEAADVPEPGSIALMLAGLGLIGMRARRRSA